MGEGSTQQATQQGYQQGTGYQQGGQGYQQGFYSEEGQQGQQGYSYQQGSQSMGKGGGKIQVTHTHSIGARQGKLETSEEPLCHWQ